MHGGGLRRPRIRVNWTIRKPRREVAVSSRALPFQNLVLIGMFGSGKSTVGRLLARRLGFHFVDVDRILETHHRKPLQRILDDLGMQGFMRLEARTLEKLQTRRCVVAPGGSAVYYPRAMAALGRLGPRVYLRVSLATLKRRLPDWSGRGVVCRGGRTLPALYRERRPLLRKYADLTVSAEGRDPAKVADAVLRRLGVSRG